MEDKQKFINEYIRNIAQQEILKDKIKQIELDIEFGKIQEKINKNLIRGMKNE